MTNEKILLVGRGDSAKFDQPLRELGWTVSHVESFAAAEGLQDYQLVIADAKALTECGEDSAWGPDKRGPRPALVISMHGSEEVPLWARKHIAGCLAQEIGRAQLSAVLQGVATRTRQQAFASPRFQRDECPEFIGGTPAVERLRQSVRNLARTHAAVLIRGEAGADLAGVANAIHQQSPWADEILVQIECGSATEAGELFGNGDGRPGKLQLAEGGTVILHHVARLPAAVQEKLIEFLSAHGEDVRVISTTAEDLEAGCKAGNFREDLFLRLSIGAVTIGPLRERKADLRELAEFFTKRNGDGQGFEEVAFSPAAFEAIEGYGWPGNVLELQYVIGRAVILASGERVIEPVHLRLEATDGAAMSHDAGALLPLDEVEKQHIFRVLERCQWNRTHAAAKLGISIRTLRNKLREYRMATADDIQEQEAA